MLFKSANSFKSLQPKDLILIHVPIRNLGQVKKTLLDFHLEKHFNPRTL